MVALLRKEINSFFSSLIGYIVIIVFLLTLGLIMWIFPGGGFNIIESGFANMDPLFVVAPWVFLFLIPAVTMKMFAEEHRSGTIEILLTQPISDLQIVLAKFFSAVILVVIALLPTSIYYISIYQLANPVGNIDTAGIVGSYIGLIFLCSGFASIGVFASALTSNQIVSFILAVILSFFFYSGFEFLAAIISNPVAGNLLAGLGISNHYASLSRGVIDTRDVVYFISLTLLFVFSTRFILEKRKW
ncbi:MAG: gliding motility-associated ABC transporter permease subunit GldF [Bacteroidetes bacterium]|nr:gliding motility-associated ABC transporter permease subunit GldF [Bacteroidota bacterium]MBK8362238.1 gliding motility-associated ABC transporter permease subunit GldF [Bacteroidota bacterium]MBK9413088.1 gliding motility-associated ABC transporter permease subunit GldF [Bacteroidota bacterium]MBP6427650.1 gliding motility-associated ABC transporter permease subunit GldF [Bacteroidia bacterium]MBP6656895.1 gliding motility-associated ABC transporter permease subunit GldF [Bacteroidia bacter